MNNLLIAQKFICSSSIYTAISFPSSPQNVVYGREIFSRQNDELSMMRSWVEI